MSYLCACCSAKVPHGKPMIRHQEFKPNGDIQRELPVCEPCKKWLSNGFSVKQLHNTAEQRRMEKQKRLAAIVGGAAAAHLMKQVR